MGLGGVSHWIIILIIVLLLFGAGRISGIMGELGKGVKSFKEGIGDEEEERRRRYEEERRLQSRPPERPIEVTPEPHQGTERAPLRDDEPRHEAPRRVMFGVDSTELLIVAVLALLFIGPKELPATMRTVGRWVGKTRAMARHFTAGFENMVREAELEEMEKKWREENERIMREHPALAEPTHIEVPPGLDQEEQPPLPLEHPERELP